MDAMGSVPSNERRAETIASGESYVNKADCLHAIGLIKGVEGETPVKEI
ncbi:MAG: DUF1508 domain-containing protein [Rhodanobacter sp.]